MCFSRVFCLAQGKGPSAAAEGPFLAISKRNKRFFQQ